MAGNLGGEFGARLVGARGVRGDGASTLLGIEGWILREIRKLNLGIPGDELRASGLIGETPELLFSCEEDACIAAVDTLKELQKAVNVKYEATFHAFVAG